MFCTTLLRNLDWSKHSSLATKTPLPSDKIFNLKTDQTLHLQLTANLQIHMLFVTFVIRKENLRPFWYTAHDWCVFQLVLFKFLKAENWITYACKLVLYIKMTLSYLFWSQKWQNGKIFNLIRTTTIPSIKLHDVF